MHDALPILQEELLEEAGNHVHRGGRLIYSTCSIEPEENWEQVQKFLSKFDNYELEKLDDFLPEEVLIEDGYAYQTFPHKHGCDGHFGVQDRKSTRLNSSHVAISYAVFCLKKKSKTDPQHAN